jgi:hypothetical protein
MKNTSPNATLHSVLRIDAIASGASAVLLLVGGQMLTDFLGIPGGLLLALGIVLLVYAVALWLVQARPPLNPAAVQAVVAVNCLWVLASLLTVVLSWLPLTELGIAFVLVQAAAVALIADLEFIGLRRATARVQLSS